METMSTNKNDYSIEPPINTEVFVQSYKHNGSLHRTWCKAHVLEVTDEWIVAVTNKAWVIESDGRKWLTREPAVCFFWKHRWYNVIAMLRKNGIYYYCNLASPSLYDGEAIKNIDYDLDVKLYPDLSYQILDENEYNMHAREMRYPEKVMKIVERSVNELIDEMDLASDPFNPECVEKYYSIYQKMTAA